MPNLLGLHLRPQDASVPGFSTTPALTPNIMIKNVVYAIALGAAIFLSFMLFIVVAADPKSGTHTANRNGLALAYLALTVIAWAAVAAINRWRKRPQNHIAP